MSTFTQWNGPQGSSGPSAKDITDLISAYNTLSTTLNAHVTAAAPTDAAVHGIVSYVSTIKTQLEALISAKAAASDLNSIRTTANAAATQTALNAAVQELNQLIAGKADASSLNDKATVATTTALSSEINSVKSTLTTLQNSVSTKAATSDLNSVKATANAAATQTALNAAVQNLNKLIANKADYSLLDDKADVTTTTTLSNKINSVESTLTTLKNSYAALSKYITDDGVMLAFDCAIKTAEFIIGKIKAFKYIDFTQWYTVEAQYAGTGSSDDAGTNGLYVLGKLSDDWSDDTNAPTNNKFKAARCFIKYENSHPFDAIVDMVATKTSDGWSGEIQAIVSKKANEWPGLQFHLCHGTYSDGKEALYLCISADGLAKNSTEYSILDFHIAGVNFIPLDIAVSKRVQVVSNNIVSTSIVPTACANAVVANNIIANSMNSSSALSTDAIQDTQNTLLLEVQRLEDEYGQEHKYFVLGDTAFEYGLFLQRPILVTKDSEDNEVRSPFVTISDLQGMTTLHAGFICQWPVYEDVIENDEHIMYRATQVPAGFHATDGSELLCEDYPELAKLLAKNETDLRFTLPVVDFSIIKLATETYNIDTPTDIPENRTNVFNYSQLTTAIKLLNERLKNEVVRSTDKDTQHDDAIDAEETRATTAEQTLATYLTDKPVYPSVSDLPSVTPDTQGNVIKDGDIVIVFDGETIVQYKATVTGAAVTWTEV